jgi:hypothetical protein
VGTCFADGAKEVTALKWGVATLLIPLLAPTAKEMLRRKIVVTGAWRRVVTGLMPNPLRPVNVTRRLTAVRPLGAPGLGVLVVAVTTLVGSSVAVCRLLPVIVTNHAGNTARTLQPPSVMMSMPRRWP